MVYIDERLVEYSINLQVELGAGGAFGSLYTEGLQEVNVDTLKTADTQVLRDLYIFDYWIRNGDRNLGDQSRNPNLFYNIIDSSLVVFDHNLAFDIDFNAVEHKNMHLARHIFKGQADMFEDENMRAHYTTKFNQALLGLDNIIDSIPEEWLDEIPDALGEIERIKVILREFNHDEFWEALP